jgi:hypothetical protein
VNVTRTEAQRLVSESNHDFLDQVVRVAPMTDDSALVFGNSATYQLAQTSGQWASRALREFFTPIATYRLSDQDRYARIARLGITCVISTHQGAPGIFGSSPALATLTVPCPEGSQWFAVGRALLVHGAAQTMGVEVSADAMNIRPLSAAEASAQSANESKLDYCFVNPEPRPMQSNQRIERLDSVPASVTCEPYANQAPASR